MKVIKKYADCFFVRGAKRGILYDLSRKKFDIIPLSMVDWVEMIDGANEEKMASLRDEYDTDSVNQYMHFLEENEYIFQCEEEEADLFAKIDLNFKSPAYFSNAIFKMEDLDTLNWTEISKNLAVANCQHLQFHFTGDSTKISLEDLEDFFSKWNKSRIRSIEFYIQYNEHLDNVEWEDFCKRNKRLKSLIIHGATISKQETHGKYGMGNIVYLKIPIESDVKESMVHPYYFNTNIDLFTENQKYNSFFHKKLFIDASGNVVNNFEDNTNFGKIQDVDLIELSKDPDYTKLWGVNKNEFEDCKQCEYRYMCVDNRKPELNEDGNWVHTEACNYNPTTLEWNF